MFVLGIDPGLTTTGYALVRADAAGPVAVAAGVIRTPPDAPTELRLVELRRDLAAVVADHRPDAAAIERVFVNRNLQTAIGVARASGVALLVLGEAGIPVTEYSPSGVKKALVGTGDAPKEQVQRLLELRLGLTAAPRPADAADALAVALCHLQHLPARRRGVIG
ncbi:MAG TPA: crossover junction endodeoxyribonuclease RuvC [Actinobacteria bacterium]|nr:crossover junction endodeoxyribonuclease RuvC [Actinomycetota bacterium]